MTDIDDMLRAVVRDEIQRVGLGSAPTRALTVRDAAERLAVDQKTVRRLIQTGEIRAFRIGSKSLRIRESDIDDLIAAAESLP